MTYLSRLKKHKTEYLIRTLGFVTGIFLVYLVTGPLAKLIIRDLEDSGIVATTNQEVLTLSCVLMSETPQNNVKNATEVVVNIQEKAEVLRKGLILECVKGMDKKG